MVYDKVSRQFPQLHQMQGQDKDRDVVYDKANRQLQVSDRMQVKDEEVRVVERDAA